MSMLSGTGSGMMPRDWNRISDQILDLSIRMELAVARANVERAERELTCAKEKLADARRQLAIV